MPSTRFGQRASGGAADMTIAEPTFTIGVEEEYLLVDRMSRDLVSASLDLILSTSIINADAF